MPRFYREQFTKWQPGQTVVTLLPSDLNTLNAMTRGGRTSLSPEASLTVASYRVNKILAALVAGGKS